MGRPPLEVGTHGAIRFLRSTSGWIARTLFRDFDGYTKQVERSGKTKGEAERNLKRALKERAGSVGDGVTSESRINEVAALWFADVRLDVEAGKKSPGTEETYSSILERHVLPGLGELRVREVTVARADRFLGAISSSAGVPTAKSARSVLSGLLGYAARHGAIGTNPVRDTRPLSTGRSKEPRALTAEERALWLAQLEADEKAVRWDLPDLSRFMMATGIRVGEALALYWEDVDFAEAAVAIDYTVVRRKGKGLVRKPTKTAAGERLLPLPSWAVAMLAARHRVALEESHPASSPVFPSTEGGLRDPSNTLRVLREARGSEGFAWVTSHVFRKTAATVLDEAGLSARVIADQLGHARPSMTQDVYLGRRITSRDTAAVLEDILGKQST
ncbi:site-specific integrase [Amycolatopsis cihanbeyliensis]|uniref:Site-specific recombinase XerD n=1 Tax=Amycolatopsis cihanbeyliensis TaxID=1128664 RepID=A0A542DKL4_AMYCI|nr:site-specific integrase [Amycolatopsis cihanbeyliensis]TQJ03475.1 site-specific recombinase XerD [Amycolatopsis cihanbeyliensis]